jgi:hypothetical protein
MLQQPPVLLPAGLALRLAQLALMADGWWHWPDDLLDGPAFVSLSEWRCLLRLHQARGEAQG